MSFRLCPTFWMDILLKDGKEHYDIGNFHKCIEKMNAGKFIANDGDKSDQKSYKLAMMAKYRGFANAKLGNKAEGRIDLTKALSLINEVSKNLSKICFKN